MKTRSRLGRQIDIAGDGSRFKLSSGRAAQQEVRAMNRSYWMCQVLGWLAYSAVGISMNLVNGASLSPLLIGHLAFILSSIGLTHLFRWEIRKRWPEMPLSRLWHCSVAAFC